MDLDRPRKRPRPHRLLPPLPPPLPHPLPPRLHAPKLRHLHLRPRAPSALLLSAHDEPRSRGRALAADPDAAGAGAGEHGVADREPDAE